MVNIQIQNSEFQRIFKNRCNWVAIESTVVEKRIFRINDKNSSKRLQQSDVLSLDEFGNHYWFRSEMTIIFGLMQVEAWDTVFLGSFSSYGRKCDLGAFSDSISNHLLQCLADNCTLAMKSLLGSNISGKSTQNPLPNTKPSACPHIWKYIFNAMFFDPNIGIWFPDGNSHNGICQLLSHQVVHKKLEPGAV